MTEQDAKEYIKSVNWRFAKTYLSAPHEYTVGEWKPELHDKMIEFAKYIREHGKITYFWGKPFIKLFLDGYQYWTMDKNLEDTTLINRTFLDNGRCERVKRYTMSENYIHEHGETLYQVEQRAMDYENKRGQQ